MEIGAGLGIPPGKPRALLAMTRRRSRTTSYKGLEGRPRRQAHPRHPAITRPLRAEGKTTTTVGLGDGLNRIGKQAAICIREASLGPHLA